MYAVGVWADMGSIDRLRHGFAAETDTLRLVPAMHRKQANSVEWLYASLSEVAATSQQWQLTPTVFWLPRKGCSLTVFLSVLEQFQGFCLLPGTIQKEPSAASTLIRPSHTDLSDHLPSITSSSTAPTFSGSSAGTLLSKSLAGRLPRASAGDASSY